MIQRIQTIYLFIAALLMGMLFFVPFAEIANSKGEIFRLDAKGFYPVSQNAEPLFRSIPIIVLLAVTIVFIFYVIFKFRKLSVQKGLAKLSILMVLVISGLICYDIWRCSKVMEVNFAYNISLVIPIIAIIFIFLAIKAINKDDQLLKSIDRIR